MSEEVEEWRPVVGWEGLYEVSSLGRVRSLPRVVVKSNRYGGRSRFAKGGNLLKAEATTHTGYRYFTAYGGGRRLMMSVHSAVCRAFHGPPPSPDHEVRHLDGDRGNARAGNLAWGTRRENSDDRRRHGTMPIGHLHWTSKLKPADVALIRASSPSDEARLAQALSVTRATIRNARLRATYQNLP